MLPATHGLDEGSKRGFPLQAAGKTLRGAKMFSSGDLPALRREIPMSVLLDIMTKMQGVGEEESPDAVKS